MRICKVCVEWDCVLAWLYHGGILAVIDSAVLGLGWWVFPGNWRLFALLCAALAILDYKYIKSAW